MEFRSIREVRKERDKAFERLGKIWAACGITWFIFSMLVDDVPVIGTLAYWGIYVGAVVATVILVREMVRVSRSAEAQIQELKRLDKF
jgi:hypothetical protein